MLAPESTSVRAFSVATQASSLMSYVLCLMPNAQAPSQAGLVNAFGGNRLYYQSWACHCRPSYVFHALTVQQRNVIPVHFG